MLNAGIKAMNVALLGGDDGSVGDRLLPQYARLHPDDMQSLGVAAMGIVRFGVRRPFAEAANVTAIRKIRRVMTTKSDPQALNFPGKPQTIRRAYF